MRPTRRSGLPCSHRLPEPRGGREPPLPDRLNGALVQSAAESAQQANVAIKDFLNLPYQRSLQELSAGQRQCHPFVARTPKHEPLYRWVAPTRRIVTTELANLLRMEATSAGVRSLIMLTASGPWCAIIA